MLRAPIPSMLQRAAGNNDFVARNAVRLENKLTVPDRTRESVK